jgi:hypothetical protein
LIAIASIAVAVSATTVTDASHVVTSPKDHIYSLLRARALASGNMTAVEHIDKYYAFLNSRPGAVDRQNERRNVLSDNTDTIMSQWYEYISWYYGGMMTYVSPDQSLLPFFPTKAQMHTYLTTSVNVNVENTTTCATPSFIYNCPGYPTQNGLVVYHVCDCSHPLTSYTIAVFGPL